MPTKFESKSENFVNEKPPIKDETHTKSVLAFNFKIEDLFFHSTHGCDPQKNDSNPSVYESEDLDPAKKICMNGLVYGFPFFRSGGDKRPRTYSKRPLTPGPLILPAEEVTSPPNPPFP